MYKLCARKKLAKITCKKLEKVVCKTGNNFGEFGRKKEERKVRKVNLKSSCIRELKTHKNTVHHT